MLFDSHIHIDLYNEPHRVVNSIDNMNMTAILVTNLPSYYNQAIKHLGQKKRIRVALGYHPLYISPGKSEFDLFVKNVKETSYIGEIGLDFSSEGVGTKEKQITMFSKILDVIMNRTRFISIHSRSAEEYVMKMLSERKIKNIVFHWYSGSYKVLDNIIEQGYYLSINPAMIFNAKGKKIIERMPRKQILTETDGPFAKVRGNIVKPDNINDIIVYLSKVWNCPVQEAENQIWANFIQIVNSIKIDL
jgi:TatD DNase family protein